MKIEFICNGVKNIELIYKIKEEYDKDWGGDIQREDYLGKEYSQDIIDRLCSQVQELNEICYCGQTERIANEEYRIKSTSQEYLITFTFDTFNDRNQTQISVKIISHKKLEEYDVVLEKVKICIKQLLLEKWEVCTWIIDEQSEYLGMTLYPYIFKIENKLRGLINQVLTRNFGVNWMNSVGFESILASYRLNSVDFKRQVPQFNNINDVLISTTIETIAKLLFKTKIYEAAISLTSEQCIDLHTSIANNNPNSVYELIRSTRKVKIGLWEDVFEKFFPSIDLEREIKNLIKNRNHIAHNKLLDKLAFEKMLRDFISLDKIIDNANNLFLQQEPSEQLCETWEAEEQQQLEEQEYIYNRIRNEAGIEVLDYKGISRLFEAEIDEIYTLIDDAEYFNNAVEIGQLNKVNNTTDEQIIFSVHSNVEDDFTFNVCVSVEISEGMGEESYLHIWIEKNDNSRLLETSIIYYNGEAYEDRMECCYIPETESYIEKKKLLEFVEELRKYILEDMNPIKLEMDRKIYNAVRDGDMSPVANFPCWNCYENYISVDEEVYTYGKCANCGEENEIRECFRCQEIYPADQGGEELCEYCLEKLEEE